MQFYGNVGIIVENYDFIKGWYCKKLTDEFSKIKNANIVYQIFQREMKAMW